MSPNITGDIFFYAHKKKPITEMCDRYLKKYICLTLRYSL